MLVLLRCRGEHEIMFQIWNNLNLWGEIRRNVISSLSWDSVIKIWCHDVPSRGFSFIISRRRKNKADHYSSHLLSCIVNALNKYHVIISKCQGEMSYNAYEKDIAIVNIFFGDSTVFGNFLSVNICLHIKSHVWRLIISVAHAIL